MQEDLLKGIIEAFEQNYKIPYSKVVPFRGTVYFVTSSGKYIAKKIDISIDRFYFIHDYKEYMALNGFIDTDRYVADCEGKVLFDINGEKWAFCLMSPLSESNFDDNEQLVRICRKIGKMHKVSEGFEVTHEEARLKDELGKLPSACKKRLEELKRLRKKAEKGRSGFDIEFLPNCHHFIELGNEAIKLIDSDAYQRCVDECLKLSNICHCDLTYQNILADKNHVVVVNFENSARELKTYDLVNLIRRKMRKCDWDIKQAAMMIDAYSKKNTISKDDLIILKAMLMFPQKFWRIVNKYYNSKRGWAERNMLIKLQEACAEKDAHYSFIKEFDKLIK